jgi:hypothetical protein
MSAPLLSMRSVDAQMAGIGCKTGILENTGGSQGVFVHTLQHNSNSVGYNCFCVMVGFLCNMRGWVQNL